VRGRALAACAATAILASVLPARAERAGALRLTVDGASIVVLVPKMFAPLLEGSFYPNRRKPVPAEHRPVAILGPGLKPIEEYLLDRGFLVVEGRELRGGVLGALIKALEERSEADPTRCVVIARGSLPPDLPIHRAVVFDPSLGGAAAPSLVSLDLLLRSPAQEPSAALSNRLRNFFGVEPAEKWYRAEKDFPEQAYRDAVECAAAAVAR
jgi:hypothetical protein